MTKYLNWIARPAEGRPEITHLSLSHAFLVVILLLLAFELGGWEVMDASPLNKTTFQGNLMVVGMLLLNQLSFGFKWSPVITACLRISALIWLLITWWWIIIFTNMVNHLA